MAPQPKPWATIDQRRQLARELYVAGYTHDQIGMKLGCGASTVRRDLMYTEPEVSVSENDSGLITLDDQTTQRIKELEQENRKLRKQVTFEERITRVVEKKVENLDSKYKGAARAIPKAKSRGPRREAILLFSDLHAGEKVSREETMGVNEYDWSVMLRRMRDLRDKALGAIDDLNHPVQDLLVSGLGDMCGGDIHPELAETNELPLAEVAVQLGLDITEWLDDIGSNFTNLRYISIFGNHGRLKEGKPRAKQAFNNADYITGCIVRAQLKSRKNTEVLVPKASELLVPFAKNYNMLNFHGDIVRGGGSATPWTGVQKRAQSLVDRYRSQNQQVDLIACGHFHEASIVKGPAGSTILVNGSLKGADEYALRVIGKSGPPEQILCLADEKQGVYDYRVLTMK